MHEQTTTDIKMTKKWLGLGVATKPWRHSETAFDDAAIFSSDRSVLNYISFESPQSAESKPAFIMTIGLTIPEFFSLEISE